MLQLRINQEHDLRDFSQSYNAKTASHLMQEQFQKQANDILDTENGILNIIGKRKQELIEADDPDSVLWISAIVVLVIVLILVSIRQAILEEGRECIQRTQRVQNFYAMA